MAQQQQKDKDIDIDLGKYHLIIQHRFQVLHILNDIAISLWFLVGSILFFHSEYQEIGTWLFVIGSAQMIVRPVIGIAHKVHLKKAKKRYIDSG